MANDKEMVGLSPLNIDMTKNSRRFFLGCGQTRKLVDTFGYSKFQFLP